MKKYFLFIIAVLLMAPMTVNAQKEKKKKEKKEKKEFVWELPNPLSGNADIDNYLLSCDTLWTNIEEYSDNLTKFEFKNDTVYTADGRVFERAWMEYDNQLVTKGQTNWQLVDAILSCTNILLDCTNIGLQTATATLSLPDLGLNALKFGKYVKVGPKIIMKGKDELGEIVRIRKSQYKTWKDMKTNALTKEEVAALGLSDSMLEKVEKCVFYKEIKPEDKNYSYVMENKESYKESGNDLEAMVVAPELRNYDLQEDLSDDIMTNLENQES